MMKWVLIFLATAGAVSAIILAQESTAKKVVPNLREAPVVMPFESGIAGTGIIEPASENVMIGIPEPGLVTRVYVTEGQVVKSGDPLFQTDSRGLEAELLTDNAAVLTSQAELDRIVANGRIEEEAILRAKLDEAIAGISEAEESEAQARAIATQRDWIVKDDVQQLERLELAMKSYAVAEEQVTHTRYTMHAAEAELLSAQSNVKAAQARIISAKARKIQAEVEWKKRLAGAWAPDVKKARVAVEEAQAKVARTKLEIERHTMRSPLDASVIRLNLREGEYLNPVSAQPENSPVVLGDLRVKHVRANFDEFDAQRLTPGMKAAAYLKGKTIRRIPLELVRVEPFIIPKRAVTNSPREIVDTRVLEVIYKICDPAAPVFVGQQVDVFIESEDGDSNVKGI